MFGVKYLFFFFKQRNTFIQQECIKLIKNDSTDTYNVLEQQISILEWFLKDHVTLKTEVMMLKIQFSSQE